MIVGARIVSTCLSTKASHEQSAMPTHGTHVCQVGAPTVWDEAT
jgi:hypothetical protein